MEKKIFVWTKLPGNPPRHVWISNSLKNLQNYVGGNIEHYKICSNFGVICNEEGRLNGMEFNCSILGVNFFGPLIFVGHKKDQFADCPLMTSEEVKRYIKEEMADEW